MEQHYTALQNTLDQVVGQIGVKRTVSLLDSFMGKDTTDHTDRYGLIHSFVVSEIIALCQLDTDQFYTNGSSEYREARMIAYRVFHKFTQLSYHRCAMYFQVNTRKFRYHYQRMNDALSVPDHYAQVVHLYDRLCQAVVVFLSKL